VNGPARAIPDRLVFTFSKDELIAYSRIVSMRQDRGPSYSNFRAVMTVIVFGLGFVVLLAKYLGWIAPSQLRLVLFTAYAAFFAGALAYHGALHLGYRRITRTMSRSGEANGPYQMVCDESGFVYGPAQARTRVPWDAIADIRKTGSMVMIWNATGNGYPIPARIFPDLAQCEDFVAAIREQAANAKADRSSGPNEN
jgi:hypothetical protein